MGFKKDKNPTVHSISYWIRTIIVLAYKYTALMILHRLNRVRAREVRAVSTSLAATKHIPVKNIMRNAYWKSESTFTSFYMKDLAKYNKEVKDIDTVAAGFSLQI